MIATKGKVLISVLLVIIICQTKKKTYLMVASHSMFSIMSSVLRLIRDTSKTIRRSMRLQTFGCPIVGCAAEQWSRNRKMQPATELCNQSTEVWPPDDIFRRSNAMRNTELEDIVCTFSPEKERLTTVPKILRYKSKNTTAYWIVSKSCSVTAWTLE